mgnify:CR=1 FL=1
MKGKRFALLAFCVGLALLGAGGTSAMMVEFPSAPAAAVEPTPALPSSWPMTMTAPITPGSSIRDVGQFTSGAEDRNDGEQIGTPDTVGQVRAPGPCDYPLPDQMCVYSGDLHSHTGYSDGQGTPQIAYQMARANGLHFFAVTDHAELLSTGEWNATLEQALAATVESEFVALRGFEWTSQYGHANVFNTSTLVRSNDSRFNTPTKFYAWLSDPAQVNSVAQFNHPFYPPGVLFDDWRYDPLADQHIHLIETHNGIISCLGKYHDVLSAGWHVGAVSNSDTHDANWGERRGRTGIIASGLTYHHVIESLRARRTFSTEDENLVLAARANGYWMGSVIPPGPVYWEVYAFDASPDDDIAALTLYRNGVPFASTAVADWAFVWRVALPEAAPGSWWYVKATQDDGDAAYTSPIWIRQPEPHDALIRDTLGDAGAVPSSDPGWQSPDIWLRHQPDDIIWHQNPAPGETNYVHVRVQNVGSQPLTDVQLSAYWSDPALGFTWPAGWQAINATPAVIPNMDAGATTIARIPWSVPLAVEHASLLVHLTSDQDPIRRRDHPRWDDNAAWKNVHILDTGADGQMVLFPQTVQLYLANPFAQQQAVDVRFSGQFPPQGQLTVRLPTALFERWLASQAGGTVRGAVVDPVSGIITITHPADAAVYGLPLLAQERLTATLAFSVPWASTLAVGVSEQIAGNEVGGGLYTTSPSGTPRHILWQLSASQAPINSRVMLTATVTGEGFVPVVDGTQVWLSATLGNLSADTARTRNGQITATLHTGPVPGRAVVQARIGDDVVAAALVHVEHTCWVRLNDGLVTYHTIQEAVDASTDPDDVVKVAGYCTALNRRGGTAQVIYLAKSLTVQGGYTVTNWTTADPAAHPTMVDAHGRGRGIRIVGAVTPTVEGLHIVGGDAAGLGGGRAGEDAGGGIYVAQAAPLLWGNTLSGNAAEQGGGVYLASSDATLVNNLLVGNRASDQGSGVYVQGGAPRLLHTTLARNEGGAGVHVTHADSGPDYATATLTNTILVSHTAGIAVTTGSTATLEATLWGSDGWRNGTDWMGGGMVVTGTRNIWGNPAFVAADAGDYHLGPDTAARDAGVNAGVDTDIDGDARPMGHGPDIGADELRIDLTIAQPARFRALADGVRITYTVRVTNVGAVDLHTVITAVLPAPIRPDQVSAGTVVLPGGMVAWRPVITAPGGVWVQPVVVGAEVGYVGPLTNTVEVISREGAAGSDTQAVSLLPALEIGQRVWPEQARSGGQVTFTIAITNTGNLDLHSVITDLLPLHITRGETDGGTAMRPGGIITWTPTITAPGGVWQQPVVVTVERDYAGGLTNVVQVRVWEDAASVYSSTTSVSVSCLFYLPLVMRNFIPPIPCAPRLIREIATGPTPRAVALDESGRRAFIAHAEGISVLAMDSMRTLETTGAPKLGQGATYDPDRNRLWVTHRSPDGVLVLDGATYIPLADLPTGVSPLGVAYNPTNGRVYVANYNGGTVGVYDAGTMTYLGDLPGFTEPAHLAVNPSTNRIYVAAHAPNQGLFVIDGATHAAHRIPTTLLDAYGVALDGTRDLVYVTAIAQGRIVAVDGATEEQVGYLDLRRDDGGPMWLRTIAVNPTVGTEGHLLVLTSSHDGERDRLLLIPNGWPTWGTLAPLDLASYPLDGIAFDSLRERAWVTSVSSGVVSIVQDGEPVCALDPSLLRD